MALISIGGAAILASMAVLAWLQAPLGSPVFFAVAAITVAVYAALMYRLLRHGAPPLPRRWLTTALLLAVAFRVPLAIPRVNAQNDMIRYLWDGRVQRLGYNPYLVVPADPAMAWTHTPETRAMPSRRAHTPYPAAAQLFFRLVVTVRDSPRAMKFALVLCDLLTILALRAWLLASGRSPWLTLAYAWNPLVLFEVAHSGHIDALGTLWIVVSAWMLARRRPALASVAFVLAVATKLLPIVLAPIYWGRIRVRDAAIAGAVLAALYLPFASPGAGALPLGAVPNVVDYIRFNGPVFHVLADVITPRGAAAAAVLGGLLVAIVMRWRREVDDPAAWAWPMAVALAAAPVIYPWYLLPITPFLFTVETVPLLVWSLSVIPVYIVWERSRAGARWRVPLWTSALEYGAVLIAAAWLRVGLFPSLSGFQRHRDPQHQIHDGAGKRGGQNG
ncbi:MAG TPA: hypothetical protein VF159_01755 [Gemmatimonadaceae bacterium]